MKKNQVPVLPENYLDRNRICGILKEDADVFFVTGREGCGKTSALSGFCRGREKDVFWYSFGKEDNDPVFFRQHFFCQKDRSDGKITDLLASGGRKMIILDNLQVLKNRRILCEICSLLEENAGNLKIFLVMSDRPDSCFSRFLAAGRYRMVTDRELCFTEEELEQFICRFLEEKGSRDERKNYGQKLMQLTDGWPVAVSCLLRSLKDHGRQLCELADMEPMDVLMDTVLYDYIQDGIYGHFSVKEQQFLQQTAVFRNMDAGLCRFCIGEDFQQGILRKLRGRDLLYRYRISGRTAERYQLLFRQFLLVQAEPAQMQAMEQMACSYYVKTADYEEAFYYMKEDVPKIRSVLKQHGKEILKRGLLELLGQCLSVLKAGAVEWSVQELGIAAEYYYRTGERQQMLACLNAADSMFGKENQYGMYRSLYRGLFHYGESPDKYEKQINNVLFFLAENSMPLPFLMESEQRVLDRIRKDKESQLKEGNGIKIQVYTFGTFRAVILEDGKELSWRTKKGCELFAYLLNLNGEAVERKTLLAQLWRDEMPNHAVAMLHNMFYNIRKELSYYNLESIIQYKNKKYSMDTSIIQSDVEKVHRVAEFVERKEISRLMQERHIFDTWWGTYLEDMDNVWIREKQEYYEKIFEKGCIMTGRQLMEQGEYEEAVVYLKNALAVSCYSEKTVGLLLKCYGSIGDLNSAKRQYEEFCVLLRKELGLAPGEELRGRYRECMGSV